MTTIKGNTPRIPQRTFDRNPTVSQTTKLPSQLQSSQNSFSNSAATPRLARGNETAPRQGLQRQLPTTQARQAIPQQTAQSAQLQSAIGGGQYVKRGSSGPEVMELQKILNDAGAQPPLEMDGKFGPLTQQAVRDFQAKRGIGVDGIVGPETLGQINGGQAPTAPTQPGGPGQTNPTAPTQPNGPGQPGPTEPTPPTGPAPTTPGANGPADERIGNVIGIENTTPEFREKVAQIADRLGMEPQHLMAVMSFETGGEFKSSTRNRVSGATGLIQFMPSTARGLGTSTEALARMSPMEQLDYVEKYLKPYAGKMNTVEDAYMAVLWPAAVGKGPDHALFSSPSIQYRQNAGLDTNNNGVVTAREAASKVRARIQ